MIQALSRLVTDRVHNPDFPAADGIIQAEWRRMAAQPRALARPLVVLGGWRAPHYGAAGLALRLAQLTSARPEQVLPVSFFWRASFPSILGKTINRIHAALLSNPADGPIEIDIVGISMGGLVARALAAEIDGPGTLGDGPHPGAPLDRLRIRRIFTIGTPHRGAALARYLVPDSAARTMRPGSALLEWLDAHLPRRDYELVCYARLRDGWVGARNTAPPGMDPIWTSGLRILSHLSIGHDRRIQVDLARRLRAEPPLAVRSSPPPCD